MGRNKYVQQALGTEIKDKICNSRVLMVGAGGIGCELLKNLVLMGFGEIHVVDLDTIDVSNLNRQFLFRKEHIQQPKAHVAKEAAQKFNPHVKIESYLANIKDVQFPRTWFKSFDIVFNALDNIDARKYVNQMCISVDIPLIESGTTGFHGQAFIIKKGITACYECEPIQIPKSFPVCTIRNTPSQPIHCIVWAKSYLLTEVFGAGAEGASELDFETTGENREEMEKLKEELFALQKIRQNMGSSQLTQLVFDKVFNDDIKTSLTMESMWVGKRKPTPMAYHEFSQTDMDLTIAYLDQVVWTKEQCMQVLRDSMNRLSTRYLELKDTEDPSIDFDKDDPDTLDFVAAAANLRCYIFGIEPKSKFVIKQMAGNIIPAIATTNAIIAGACVLQVFKVFQSEYRKPGSFVTSNIPYRLMTSYERKPNPTCAICSAAQTEVQAQPNATLGNLVDSLRSTLDYNELEIFNDQGLIYEEDEEFEDMLNRRLADLQINAGSKLRVTEDSRVGLVLNFETAENMNDLIHIKKINVPAKPTPAVSNGSLTQTTSNENNIQLMSNGKLPAVDVTDVSSASGQKRSAEEELEGPAKSKAKIAVEEDGTIVID